MARVILINGDTNSQGTVTKNPQKASVTSEKENMLQVIRLSMILSIRLIRTVT